MAEGQEEQDLGKRDEVPGSEDPVNPVTNVIDSSKEDNSDMSVSISEKDKDSAPIKDENGNHGEELNGKDSDQNGEDVDEFKNAPQNGGSDEIKDIVHVAEDFFNSPRDFQNPVVDEEQTIPSVTVELQPSEQGVEDPGRLSNELGETTPLPPSQPDSPASTPSASPRKLTDAKSPLFSPRSQLSDIATDQGESFDSHFSDTDGDNSLIARQLVSEVLDRAVDQVVHDNQMKAEVERHTIPNITEDASIHQNIFLQRERGNGIDSSDDEAGIGKDIDGNVNSARQIDQNVLSNEEDDGRPKIIEDALNDEADDEDEEDEDGPPVIDESSYPGYPLLYRNYKACRQVSPGIKECLILETGEQVKFEKRKRSDSSNSNSPAKSDIPPEGNKKHTFKIVKNLNATESFPYFSTEQFTQEKESQNSVGTQNEEKESNMKIFSGEWESDMKNDDSKPDPKEEEIQMIVNDDDEGEDGDEEQLESESRILLDDHLADNLHSDSATNGLHPVPKTAKYAPAFNIDNYSSVRKDLFRHENHQGCDEEYSVETENKENIPESRQRRRVRLSPSSRPPVSPHHSRSEYKEQRDSSHHVARSSSEPSIYNRTDAYQPDVNVVPSQFMSGPEPEGNTVQDQQVSWLKMFKVLEDQHRKELKSQYAKHSSMIEQLQSTMEVELQKQQLNIQRRLDAHRDAMTESSHDCQNHLNKYGYYTNDSSNIRPSSHRKYSPMRKHSPNTTTYLSHSRQQDGYLSDSSDVDPLEVRRRLDIDRYHSVPGGINHHDISEYSTIPSDSFHAKQSLDTDFVSPHSSPSRREKRSPRSPRENYGSEIGSNRLLRGGVYSTPMPMSKGRSSKVLDTSRRDEESYVYRSATNSVDTVRTSQLHSSLGDDLNDESLSYSSRVNLREKHAKHLSDLRAYYEQELQELRSALSSSQSNKETANERILKDDNQDLRRRCEELTDQLDDANNHVRDLEQRLQGLEIRSSDYGDRYDESQRTVLTLKTRLEELHAYAKERDSILDSLEHKLKHQSKALQEAYKVQDELQDVTHRDKQSLQRLMTKYDELEKEHKLLQESTVIKERNLYDARTEMSDLNKTIMRLELKNKQLSRENENLKHKAAIAMNMSSVKTSYEESYSNQETISSSHYNSSSLLNGQPDSTVTLAHSPPSTHDCLNTSHYKEYLKEPTAEDETHPGTRISPLIKAEQELRKFKTSHTLADNMEVKTPKAFYGSTNGYPSCGRAYATGTRVDVKALTRNGDLSPRSRPSTSKSMASTRVSPKRSSVKSQPRDSPPRFDVSVKEIRDKKKVVIQERNSSRPLSDNKKSTQDDDAGKVNGSLDNTLNKIKKGEVVNKPNSTIHQKTSELSPVQTMTREERIKDRLQMIQQQEKRYDELQFEKRQLESALNRIPVHGRVDRKSKSEKVEIEKKLEKVEHELGSVRMSLRKYQVLKSSR